MLGDSTAARFVSQYGYLAILLGTMLEGETVVLAAGFLAHQGYLSLPFIIICAIIGSSASDQGLFFLSRLKGKIALAKFPKAYARACKLSESMAAHPFRLTAFALGFRFLYGLRNIAPIFLGMSSLSTRRFVLLNALGAILWAVIFSYAGYFLGKAFSAFSRIAAGLEIAVVLLIIAGGIGFNFWRHWKQIEAEAQDETEPSSHTQKTQPDSGNSSSCAGISQGSHSGLPSKK